MLNQVNLIGRIIESQSKKLNNGTSVCDFTMAVTERRKDKAGNWVDETNNVAVTAFGFAADAVGELPDASVVYCAAKLKLDSWEKDGKTFTKLKVTADSVKPLAKPDASSAPKSRLEEESPF